MSEPYISLCIPTNGVIEWVFPVLKSIYEQNVTNSLFEVIVTNNGSNDKFDKLMIEFVKRHSNLIYKKTNAVLFHNQLETLKLAKGKYLKFINHRSVLVKGSLSKIIDIIKNNEDIKPIIYFSNNTLNKERYEINNFDNFVKLLGRYISWTTGVGIWKSDYDDVSNSLKIDNISPHSCILFAKRKKNKYIIENFLFSKELETDHSKKGHYDLFKAFAIEEVSIALNLYIDGSISADTFKSVKNDYKKMVAELFLKFIIKKEPCSYSLDGFENSMGIFFQKNEIYSAIIKLIFIKAVKKTIKLLKGIL